MIRVASPTFQKATELYEQGQLRESLPHFMQAVEETASQARPDINVIYRSMLTLVQMREYAAAAEWIQEILGHIDPAETSPRLMAEFYYNLGCCYETLGKWEQARKNHTNSLAFYDLTLPRVNLGSIAYRQGNPTLGRQYHEQAIKKETTDWEILAGRSFVKLLHGDYLGGFREYESRWMVPGVKFQSYVPDWGTRWEGQNLGGKSILLISEQGVGDTIQMLRYVPLIQDMGANVTVLVQPGLKRLVAHNFPKATVIAKGDTLHPKPQFWIHLMSLPYAMGTTVETIPDAVWCHSLPNGGPFILPVGDRRFGLVTQGNKLHMSDKDRSCGQPFPVPRDWTCVGLHEETLKQNYDVKDFAGTAAIIAQLDVVVSIDSAVSHMAGAMGKECWLLPPCAPEWRWGLGNVAPWYPESHKLFRRRHVDDWAYVIENVQTALEAR